ncbi:MAG TPA: hypothetical protein VKA78_10765 [Pyrinomonadaceae bacterium]|nr:hypothetical protein [Pyrinomonadaceae bacterium]
MRAGNDKGINPGELLGSTEASGIVDQAVKETKGDSHKEAQEAQELP